MWEEPWRCDSGSGPSSCLSVRPSTRRAGGFVEPERELLRADPRYRRGSSRFTRLLSPDPELGDQGAIALDVGVPQVVQQTPLLAHQEQEAAARVVVFGVRFQVLRELPDSCGGQRDLDFR